MNIRSRITLPFIEDESSQSSRDDTSHSNRPTIRVDQLLSDPLETVRVTPEAPWDKQGEDLLHHWLASTRQEACFHKQKGHKLKRLYRILGILSILSAGIVFFVSNVPLTTNLSHQTYIRTTFSFMNLIVANLVNFLDYGPKYQRHFEYEGRFEKLNVDISEILATDKEFRPPKDRILGEYKEKIGNLISNAPET